ncbi:formate/nitrite transporter family protein [Aerococcaceae bacterium NML191292]|nr:formate/nitrite transporter family protein [Aerococcaceae bacterium NML210727]MCW6655390.1 formate/nitrite transporter family protein [Aerococcaceae bacterium NML201296]MCW6660439.1 formate/nitrite transporter family protein [Aerococcaceae bacterium NML191292]MCW6661723.1 formate/nitrite transporter family protein [Aerococcaceae bacterium NML201209]MCW6663842.1 formate/nitrite transporter family protein [Aerococcaceae bacterium NML190073]MCW6665114.1 formate/nitrite transporter family prote
MEVQNRGLIGSLTHSIHKKAELFESSWVRYAVRAMLACLFLSLGVSIASYIAHKADHLWDGTGKFAYSFMFSWSLIMIIYMNAELGTSNMMYMTTAIHRKLLKPMTAVKILLVCILFNFIGAVIVTYIVSLTDAYTNIASDHYLLEATVAKLSKTPLQQFAEGILANVVVNTAVFCSIRMKDDAGKVIAMLFIVYIFAFLGFEHVIANFSTFSLAYWTTGGAVEHLTLPNVLSNFLFSGLGNYIGGGICIGLLYSWLNEKSNLYFD